MLTHHYPNSTLRKVREWVPDGSQFPIRFLRFRVAGEVADRELMLDGSVNGSLPEMGSVCTIVVQDDLKPDWNAAAQGRRGNYRAQLRAVGFEKVTSPAKAA